LQNANEIVFFSAELREERQMGRRVVRDMSEARGVRGLVRQADNSRSRQV